jgi:cold shock protein
MTNGTIKFFNATKGFGFITPEDGSKDVFVPAVSVTASGISALKPGQLISFDTEPDSKGPKAVNLKLLADAPKIAPAPRPVQAPAMERPAIVPQMAPPRLTVFHDPSSDASHLVLDVLDDLEQESRLVDYIATPPDREALKTLSLLMRGGDQSLVRKYDPLFLELRLDDRFISDGEFWSAIVEHPSLINGPVLATPQKARVCRTEQAVKAFLGIAENAPAAKPKGIPGRAPVAPPAKADEMKEIEVAVLEAPPAKTVPKKVDAKLDVKSQPKAKAEPPAKAKTVVKAKATPAVKPVKAVKSVKKAVAKSVKKARRK